MKAYGTYVKYYDIEVEIPDDATTADIYNAVKDEIELLECTNLIEESEFDDYVTKIVDENDNVIWES